MPAPFAVNEVVGGKQIRMRLRSVRHLHRGT